MSKKAVTNDNNNFTPFIFRSMCEFVGNCLGPQYFCLEAMLPQKKISFQNNHLRIHPMTSKKMVRSYYCLNVDSTFSLDLSPTCAFQWKGN